jgi:hypothetical protein
VLSARLENGNRDIKHPSPRQSESNKVQRVVNDDPVLKNPIFR